MKKSDNNNKGKLTKTTSLIDFLVFCGGNTIEIFKLEKEDGSTVRFFKVPGTEQSGLVSKSIQEDLDPDKHVVSYWLRPEGEPAYLVHNKPTGGPATLVTSYSKE